VPLCRSFSRAIKKARRWYRWSTIPSAERLMTIAAFF
jgi:hypothetical protein